MKKIALIMVALMVSSVMVACDSTKKPSANSEVSQNGSTQETVAPVFDGQEITLGTSSFTMTIPSSYAKGDITREDTDEGMVAYYLSEESLVDFDVYHWAMATDETLESVAKAEAIEYKTDAELTKINGIDVYYYETFEKSEEENYTTATYIAEDNGYFVELVFWLDGENAESQVNDMISTLTQGTPAKVADGVIALGTSSLYLKPEKAYVAGEISRKDTDEVQVGYFKSEESLVDFDVYHWAKATGETLEKAANDEVTEYKAELQQKDINGMKVYFYTTKEESDGKEYNTVTYITEDGDYLVEVVFWLDGDNATAEADAIIATLNR